MATRHSPAPRAERRDSRPGSTQRSREASPHPALDEEMEVVPPTSGGEAGNIIKLQMKTSSQEYPTQTLRAWMKMNPQISPAARCPPRPNCSTMQSLQQQRPRRF
mmetsp:Transcript_9056/g.18906  ORF Transcript_9056/g.18906 Transcript_9056/m.18906 type:complete len:105 (-) Transcript_9056:818-1132(-)